VERLNYQLDLNAGNLKRAKGRTLTIGLLVGSFTNAFSGSIHRGIERQAWARDTAVFASSLDDGADREEAIVRAFRGRRVDGMILSTAGGSGPYLSADAARRTPLVFIGQAPPGVAADAVKSDDFTGAAQGARHLLEHGHRRIAYCGTGHNAGNQATRERYRGFMEEIGRAGSWPPMSAFSRT
jgi:LacI family transcriptional regulator